MAAAGGSNPSLGAAAAAGGSGSSLGASDSSLRVDAVNSGESTPPKWVMLDRYIFKKYDLDSFQEDEATSPEDGATTPECRTNEGDPFRLSFCISAPPGISRVFLHLVEDTIPEDKSARLIGSHRNALLFSLHWALDFRLFKQDLFIYRAGVVPSLTLLPNCPKSLEEGEEKDVAGEIMDTHALGRMIQFPGLDCVRILSNDIEDLVVASLSVTRATYISIHSSSEYDVAVLLV